MSDINGDTTHEVVEHPEIWVQQESHVRPAADGVVFFAAREGYNVVDRVIDDLKQETFTPEVLKSRISEPMQIRTDSFDVLLGCSRDSANMLVSDAQNIVGLQAQKQGLHSRGVARTTDKVGRRTNSMIAGELVSFRLDAAGDTEQLLGISLKGAYKLADARGLTSHADRQDPALALSNAGVKLLSVTASDKESNALKATAHEAANRLTAAEDNMWDCLHEELQTSGNITAFVDWLSKLDPEAQDEFAPLLELIAVDTHDDFSPHRFQAIIENGFRASARTLDQQFVYSLFASDSQMAHTARSWARLFTDNDQQAAAALFTKKDRWPITLLGSRGSFEAGIRDKLGQCIATMTKPFYSRYQQIPHSTRTSEAVLANIARGKGNLSMITEKKKVKNGRVTPRVTVTAEVDIPSENTIAMYSSDGNAAYADAEKARLTLDAAVKDFAAQYPHEKKLESDINAMIESVRTRPFGDGTTPLEGLYLPDKSRVRRLNPVHQSGLPTSTETAKDTRVLYVAKRSSDGSHSVRVLAILRHDNYSRWITNYSG